MEIVDTGIGYEHIYMKTWHPKKKEIIRFLQIVSNPKRSPILVHCQHGANRIGTMCVAYRVFIQGWNVDDAIAEMKQGGFGFHGVWVNLEPWIRKLNKEEIFKAI